MFGKKGFTLVEMLFVLVIAAGIVAYAVPSYKRAKERSTYEAAVGTLTQVGNAIQALKRQLVLGNVGHGDFPYSATSFQIPTSKSTASTGGNIDVNETPVHYIDNAGSEAARDYRFALLLYEKGYLEEDRTLNTSGYSIFAIRNAADDACNSNCKHSSNNVIACMCLPSTAGTTGCFYGARMYDDGTVEKFEDRSCR